jgi:hypothetical protein
MEALSQLLTAKYISKIDFCEAYSLIEIWDEDLEKTAI